MKPTFANFPSSNAQAIGYDCADTPDCDAGDPTVAVPYDGITMAFHGYDGPGQHATATANGTFQTLFHLAASDPFFSQSVLETPVRIAANPINKRDPSGLMPILPSVDWPYKPLPGGRFFASISVNGVRPATPGFAQVNVRFIVPSDWLAHGNGGQCDEINIIQVIVHQDTSTRYGLFRHTEENWDLDNDPGFYFSPFYGGTNTPWAGPPSGFAEIQDGPGADPTGVFRHTYLIQEFRDYAVATKGKDKGFSYGYFEWGQEWSGVAATFQSIWMNNKSRSGSLGDPMSLSGYEDPKPGGVRYRTNGSAEPI